MEERNQKSKKVLKILIFISAILFVILALLVSTAREMHTLDGLLYVFGAFIDLVVLILMWMIYLIKLSVKKRKNNEKNFWIPLIIAISIPLLIYIIIVIDVNYSTKLIENKVKNENSENSDEAQIIEELTDKYGDGDFKIITKKSTYENQPFLGSSEPDYDYLVSTNYMESRFVKMSYGDNFLDVYAQEKFGINSFSDYIKNVYKNKASEKLTKKLIPDEYEARFEYKDVRVDRKYLSEDFGKIPTVEDLEDFCCGIDPEIYISKVFTKEQEFEFAKYVVELYQIFSDNLIENSSTYDNTDIDFSSDSSMVRFYFDYENPFKEGNEHYTDGGYVKNGGEYILVYDEAHPVYYNKKTGEITLQN